ncbi:EAL domain-containing protein [Sinomonas sp. G460-2]|uniref:EAL domain-containing protein n=1 Tax=Sinomonas sp. G460-2 TaxID=3393464 RepID=UPI0039EF30F0
MSSKRSSSASRLAQAIPTVPASTPAVEVDGMFRMSPDLRGVAVLDAPNGPALLTRNATELHLSGRLGYGRALHSRSSAGQLLPESSLVLTEETTLDEAADLALGREEASRYDDLLLLGPNGPHLVTVSQLFEQLSASFRHAAWHDQLTGLVNRRWLADRGPSILARTDPGQTAILYLDLDNFKTVNDTFGHEAGDAVLAEFGRRLSACLRDGDTAVRLGGDEFAAVLLGATGPGAEAAAARILDAAAQPFDHGGHALRLSATIGVAIASDVSLDDALSPLDALLRYADGAMLAGKRRGKRRVQTVASGDADPFARKAKVQRELLTALEEDAFDLRYEPVLKIDDGGEAALLSSLHWEIPGLGAITPEELIPVAERSHQLGEIGRWELERVCRKAAQIAAAEGPDRPVILRASSAWLAEGSPAENVAATLAGHGLTGSALRLVFTGPIPSVRIQHAQTQLRGLDLQGVQTGLDDFGGCQPRLLDLRSLPFSMLYVSQALTEDIDTDEAAAALAASLAQTARALGMSVAATGVERHGQLEVLRELGYREASGPLVSALLGPEARLITEGT